MASQGIHIPDFQFIMLYELLDFTENQFPAGLGWHDQVMAGFPQRSLWTLSRALGVQPEDTAQLVGLPVDEVNWRTRATQMPAEVSDKLFNIARAYQRLMVVFKDEEQTRQWLRVAQDDLEGEIPVVLLTTAVGTRLVLAVIEAIKPVKKVEMSVVYGTSDRSDDEADTEPGCDTDVDDDMDPREIE